MKNKVLSLLILATFLFSTAAFAQIGERNRDGEKQAPEKREMQIKKRQAMQKGERQGFFTDEQKEAMKVTRLETAKQVKPLKNELRELEARQNTLTTADKADLKAINKNIDKMSEIKAEIAKIMAAQHQQIRAMLTEEQLLKFDAMKEKGGNGPRGDLRGNRIPRGAQPQFRKGA